MSKRRVLIIAPHADDETLGMGGTISKKMDRGEAVTVAVMTGHGTKPHPLGPQDLWDTIRGEANLAMTHLGEPALEFFELPAVTLSEYPMHLVNDLVAKLIEDVAPHELYLPFYHDLHNDHRILCKAGLVASRAYLPSSSSIDLVAMYETPTETHLMPSAIHNSFTPNLYSDISGYLDRKIAAWDCYKSQHHRGYTPRNPSALHALATLRGSEVGIEAAEGYIIIRHILR